uniref:Uncharacterized protein n=1 Tax=Anguilla anguilla TaxID=7936 RepID=A0A0E9XCW5_ANGAN
MPSSHLLSGFQEVLKHIVHDNDISILKEGGLGADICMDNLDSISEAILLYNHPLKVGEFGTDLHPDQLSC